MTVTLAHATLNQAVEPYGLGLNSQVCADDKGGYRRQVKPRRYRISSVAVRWSIRTGRAYRSGSLPRMAARSSAEGALLSR